MKKSVAGENLIYGNIQLMDDIEEYVLDRNIEDLNRWPIYVKEILSERGWNKKAINDFIAWGDDGYNNNALHSPSTPDEFYSELSYSSDRMSLDSLFRCHVLWQNIQFECSMFSSNPITEKKIKQLTRKLWDLSQKYRFNFEIHNIVSIKNMYNLEIKYHLLDDLNAIKKVTEGFFNE